MKTMILLLVMICMAGTLRAQEDRYQTMMQKQIEALYQADSIPQIQPLVNTMERIAEAEKTKWEPYYYAAFGYVNMSHRVTSLQRKDECLDQALETVKVAEALAPEEAEIIALRGFIYIMQLSVDPNSRGQEYSGMAFQTLGKALRLSPENPRALALMAHMQYGAARYFGDSVEEACATLATAFEKFDTFTSENPLAPTWGLKMAESLRGNCP